MKLHAAILALAVGCAVCKASPDKMGLNPAGLVDAGRYHDPKFSHREMQPNKFLRKAMRATVIILVKHHGGIGGGAGVVLEATHGKPLRILSVAHLALGSVQSMAWVWLGERVYGVKIHWIYIDKVTDLAMAVSEEPWSREDISVPLAMSKPEEGDGVFVIGNPNSEPWKATHGIITNQLLVAGVEYFQTDCLITLGNSGGGAWNDQGELIGIAQGTGYVSVKDEFGIVRFVPMIGSGRFLSWGTLGRWLEDHP